ncbi:hypothetical protein ACHAWU_004756 [Discostella pseudostelligera]|uniref:Uncharacterized protein n=1 Tax=Discostella pseudostelligera TaxID=259834 RepID=A0ABD3MH61_9STRA
MIRSIYNFPPRRLLVFAIIHAGLSLLMNTAPLPLAEAFTTILNSHARTYYSSSASFSSSSSLHAMSKRNNKFNKQKDLAAKMAEAKRQRELTQGDDDASTTIAAADDSVLGSSSISSSIRQEELLSAEDIKLRNDRQRFADLLENSLSSGGGGDFDRGYYLTVEQENENADAVFRGVTRLYEGDPAPTTPFAELLDVENGEAIGKGGMKRLVPWEGSRSTTSADYLVVITDPRPKSVELRTGIKRLSGALKADVLKKCVIINADTPSENRRFLKKNFEEKTDIKILSDENLEWMREYTALGEKRCRSGGAANDSKKRDTISELIAIKNYDFHAKSE